MRIDEYQMVEELHQPWRELRTTPVLRKAVTCRINDNPATLASWAGRWEPRPWLVNHSSAQLQANSTWHNVKGPNLAVFNFHFPLLSPQFLSPSCQLFKAHRSRESSRRALPAH